MTTDPFAELLHRPLRTARDRNQQLEALLGIAGLLADGQRAGRPPEHLRRHLVARLNRTQLQQLVLLLVGVAADAFVPVEPETDHTLCDLDPCPACSIGARPSHHQRRAELEATECPGRYAGGQSMMPSLNELDVSEQAEEAA